MALGDQLNALEKAVAAASTASSELAKAEEVRNAAQVKYNNAVAAVEKLRTEINDVVGNMFGSSKIRIA
jgi:hypothetical protein